MPDTAPNKNINDTASAQSDCLYEAFARYVEHKLNNVIQPVIGFTSILERKTDDPEALAKCILSLKSAASDLKNFTEDFLQPFYADREKETVNAATFISDTFNTLQTSENDSPAISLNLADDCNLTLNTAAFSSFLYELYRHLINTADRRSPINISLQNGTLIESLNIPSTGKLSIQYHSIDTALSDIHEDGSTLEAIRFQIISKLAEMLNAKVDISNDDSTHSIVLNFIDIDSLDF